MLRAMIRRPLTGVIIGVLWLSCPAAAADCTSSAPFSGPIVITRGGTYSGNWESLSPAIPVMRIHTSEPVTIIYSQLRGPGDLLVADIGSPRSNVTVKESCFLGTYPAAPGTGKGKAIFLYEPVNAVIEHNNFESTGGYHQGWTTFGTTVGVFKYSGNSTLSNTIKVRYNRFHNLDARFSDGLGGYLTDRTCHWSVGINLLQVFNVPGIEVAWNEIVHEPYQGCIGDSININDTRGTPSSPALIHDNYVQGGWDADPTKGTQFPYFGSAITTDGAYQTDPDLTVSFVKLYDNQAVGFGNLGISISLGHDVEMYNNRAVSDGMLPDGTPAATEYAIGIQHMNWRNNPPSTFYNTSVHDNFSGLRTLRSGVWQRQDYYFGPPPTVDFNNVRLTPMTTSAPTAADEVNEFFRWKDKVATNNVTIGVHPAIAPTAPATLAASSSGSTVFLAWTEPAIGPSPVTYYIEAGSAPGAANLANFSTGSSATSFSAPGVPSGTYFVRVKAANPYGVGPASPEATLVVGALCTGPPPPPLDFSHAVAGRTVTLTWNPAAGATSYVIEAGSTPASSNLVIFDTGNSNAGLVVPGVPPGTYFVRVRAKNPCGVSGPSNEIIVLVV
jgi:chitinase